VIRSSVTKALSLRQYAGGIVLRFLSVRHLAYHDQICIDVCRFLLMFAASSLLVGVTFCLVVGWTVILGADCASMPASSLSVYLSELFQCRCATLWLHQSTT